MQEKIKEIVAVFLKLPKEQIGASTVLDRSAVSSSILLHRMYAKLATEGIMVRDYQEVRTFNDLLQRVSGDAGMAATKAMHAEPSFTALADTSHVSAGHAGNIGIDIEEVSAMPISPDFREDTFYTMNFAPDEIAYCILQPDPYASFAGLFAAKEAIVKADNNYKNTGFNHIHIRHLPGGRPFHPAFHLSISHTGTMATAIALPVTEKNNVLPVTGAAGQVVVKAGASTGLWALVFISFLLSLVTLFLLIKK